MAAKKKTASVKSEKAATATVKKKAAPKAEAKKAPAKKKASSKAASAPKASPAKKGAAASAPKETNVSAPAPRLAEDTITPNKFFNKTALKKFRQLLLNHRDEILDDINFLAGDNLNRSARDASGDLSSYSIHMADQGTDNFDREFALNRVSGEQDILYEINEALERIRVGTYGICEASDKPIETMRLEIIPHARLSVAAQNEIEKGRRHYRPFGPSMHQL